MKKRIERLFNEAGFHNPEMERLGIEYKFEKFAELIVQDCVSEVAMMGITNFENEDISWAVDVIITNIKNRFGV